MRHYFLLGAVRKVQHRSLQNSTVNDFLSPGVSVFTNVYFCRGLCLHRPAITKSKRKELMKKDMKKLMGILLLITMLAQCLPVFAEETEETADAKAVLVEMENADVVEGLFKVVSSNSYSGGKGMQVYETKEEESYIEVPFEVETDGEYDLHILSTNGNTDYVSKYKWKLDDEEDWRGYSGVSGTGGYSQGDYGVPVSWLRVADKEKLSAGEHRIKIMVSNKRTMASDFMYCFVDCVYVVPSSWDWMPFNLSEPYNIEKMKFEYVDGKISKETVKQEQSLEVTAENTVTETTPYNATLRTELRYKGQMVTYSNYAPDIPTKSWKAGKKYSGKCTLTVPFNAPDGLYEVWTGFLGINYANGDEMHKIGELVVGEIPKLPEKGVISAASFDIPGEVKRAEKFSVKVRLTANKKAASAKAYLAFYKGKELWYAAEQEGRAFSLAEKVETEKNIEFEIKEDVPDGDYKVVFGIHGFDTEKGEADVRISGGAFMGERTYKPLSYGKYSPEKTGNTHFWYVNQNHAMIWDGEPYIPIGGMYCSNYILGFNINDPAANKKRWDAEIVKLEEFKKQGIKHVYINSNRVYENIPGWALETYFDLLEQYDIKYGFQIGSGVWESEYYAVRSNRECYEADATDSGTVTFEKASTFHMGGSIIDVTCVYIAVDTQTGEAVDSGAGAAKFTPSGTILYSADITVPKKGDYKVYFTPRVRTEHNNVIDPFCKRDEVRKGISDFANAYMAGDNFRDFIDILSNESGFTNWVEGIRLDGKDAHAAYVKWLEEKYKTVDKINEAWKMLDAVPDIDTAADLMPVYTDIERGIIYNEDIKTHKIYKSDIHGLLWDEYIDFRETSFAELNNEMSDVIKSTQNTNVPVVIKHISILEDYNVQKHTYGGVDGLGGEIYGDFSMATAKRTYPYSEVEQSAKTMWFVITECNTEENMILKTEQGPTVYESEEYMHQFFDDHMADGAKGIYDFLVFGDFFSTLPVYSYHSKPEAYTWSKNYREKVEKNADKIASTKREDGRKQLYFYPGGQSWWYMPNKRNAALPNDDYVQTRPSFLGDRVVLQTFNPTVDKEALFVNLEDAPATVKWGEAFNEYLADKPEGEKVIYLGLRKDLGTLPEIDKYYTDETFQNGEETIQVLKPTESSEIIFQTDGKVWGLRDGDLYIVSNTGWFTGPIISDQYTGMKYVDELGIDFSSQKSSDEFDDIKGHWGRSDILKLYGLGIVKGIGGNLFAPDKDVTRAELLQMAFAAIKMNKYEYGGCYDDVSAGDWYASVMQTANETKIIPKEMIDNGNISPNKSITREETAAVMSQILSAAGKTKEGDISAFNDYESVSTWAAADMKSIVGQEIMLGDENKNLNPKSPLTRAEACSLIKRFINVYLAQ